MSFSKRLLCLLTAALIILSSVPSALAEDISSEEEPPTEEESYSYTLDGKTWDEITSEFLQQYDPEGKRISLGYYNTVTGETHYVNKDKYFLGASFYKLPLCMFFVEQINNGIREEDSFVYGYKLSELIRGSIVNSSNEYAHVLMNTFKENKGYRKSIAQYVGVDPETMPTDSPYWSNTYFNAEQMLTCLRTLYDNPDKFQILMDYMLLAHPDKYFKYNEQPVEVGHKYGYIEELGSLFVNDCGICYTEDPILIVMFTKDCRYYTDALPEYCTLMIEYAQASREQRLEDEERRAEEDRIAREAEEAEKERIAEEERLKSEAEEAAKALAEAQAAETAEEAVPVLEGSSQRKTALIVLYSFDGLLVAAFLILKFRKSK